MKSNLKKRTLGLGIMLISILFTGIFIQSCTSLITDEDTLKDIDSVNKNEIEFRSLNDAELQANEFRFINQKYQTPESIPIWKAQLDKIIENNSLIKQSELEMIEYQYVRKIDSQDELRKIKSEMIENNTFFPVYENNSGKFMIIEQGMSKYDYNLLLDMIMPDTEYAKNSMPVKSDGSPLSDAVYFFEKNDLSIVNLEWKYKGKKLNTICLVSEKKGIVFDNFLYFIHFVSGKSKTETNVSKAIPRLKSTNAEDGNGELRYTFQKWDESYNFYGIRVWYYNIECSVTGSWVGGLKSITDKSMHAFSDHAFGFDCKAQIQSISFETGTNGHLDFAWAWTWGYGFNVGISWNGSGFTISGGGTQDTGEEYIGANELN